MAVMLLVVASLPAIVAEVHNGCSCHTPPSGTGQYTISVRISGEQSCDGIAVLCDCIDVCDSEQSSCPYIPIYIYYIQPSAARWRGGSGVVVCRSEDSCTAVR
jgi:hypothetical protein